MGERNTIHSIGSLTLVEASFSGSLYGKIYTIDDYLSGDEMEQLAPKVSMDHIHDLSDIYPNVRLWENQAYESAFHKTKVLWDHWDRIAQVSSDADVVHIGGHVGYEYNLAEPAYLRERLQASPAHMREYEPHTDYGAKALTIIVPIAPGVNEPTRFHGYDGTKMTRSIPWVVNQAYVFRPTANHSWHSYIGGDADRYVLNINFMYSD